MAGVLATLAGAGVGAVGTAISNQQNMENQRKLMNKANKQAQENQRNAYVNQKEGMQRAGISTAMLAGSQPQVATGTAPSAPSSDFVGGMKSGSDIAFGAMEAFKQLALMNSEKDLMEANAHNSEANANYTEGAKTENTEADTELKGEQNTLVHNQGAYQSIINERENQKDATTAKQMLHLFPNECKRYMKEHGLDEEAFIAEATTGMLDGIVGVERGKADRQQAVADYALARVKASPVYTNAIKTLPQKEIEQIDSTIDKMAHEKIFLDSLAVLNAHNANLADSQASLADQKVKEAIQNIENMKQAINESKTRQWWYRTGSFKNVTSGVGDIVDSVADVATAGKFSAVKKGMPEFQYKSDPWAGKKPNVVKDKNGTPHPAGVRARSFDEFGDFEFWYDSKGGYHKAYLNPHTGKYE